MPNLETTSHFRPLYDPSHPAYNLRNLTWYGGRGGRKSWEIARGLLLRGINRSLNILCTREYQNSISDSVFSVLENQAQLIGCEHLYEFQNNVIYSRKNDTVFSFRGLRKNINSIKSFEGIDLVWNEEAQTTSQKSIDILYPTIRKVGAQIITSFNPDQDSAPIHVKLITNHNPANSYLCKINYTDNPWIDQAFVEEAERLRDSDYESYSHIYLGNTWQRSDAQVFNGKWIVGEIEDLSEANGPYFGLDFGFSVDPTFIVKVWIVKDKLYIEYEYSKTQLDIVDHPAAVKTIPDASEHTIRADSARPETISHLVKSGLKVVGVDKWKGSVEDGIAVIRSFKQIVINPRCKEMIQEARLYRYKEDPLTGDILPVLIDKHNHGWDAVRYALAPFITRKSSILDVL